MWRVELIADTEGSKRTDDGVWYTLLTSTFAATAMQGPSHMELSAPKTKLQHNMCNGN